MIHRGPDDEGVHVDPASGCALGARRLSIIDVDGGHQPVANEDGTVWAILNGEIYNHPALQKRLARGGHSLSSRADTEVLVHLYEEFGAALVHALEGMFAFAVWDERRQRLVVARDRFGEKPLFYREEHGELWFASELSALTAAAGHELDLSIDAVDAYFVFGYVPGPGTILEGVQELPPGTILEWQRGSGARLRRYWTPPVCDSRGDTRAGGEVDAEFADLLRESVRSRLISDVPLGVFLSGGVDSTLIAALAAQASPKPVKTFTVTYETGDVGEETPARSAAEAIGSEHHELVLTGDDVSTRVPTLLARLDQPLADQALVALSAVAEFARQEVTVVVGGEGADELFGGYPRYRWLRRGEELRRFVPRSLAAGGARALRSLDGRRALARLGDVLAPESTLERHLDWVTDGRRRLRPLVYGRRLAERATTQNRVVLDELRGSLPPLERYGTGARFMALDQMHWLPYDVLAKADRAGMLASLEVRTPYLHHGIAEAAAAVPERAHLAGGGKGILRRLLRRELPSLPDRRKTAFRVPAADWLRGPLAPILRDGLSSGALYQEEWVSRAPVERMVSEHLAGRHDWTPVLWPLVVLAFWLDGIRSRA